MKYLILTTLSIAILNSSPANAAAIGSSLKTEGTCGGNLLDGTPVSLTYYSDFDGCKEVSKSAIAFHDGIEGLFTGSRAFRNNKDIYNFPRHMLSFADSTGNTSGLLEYRDHNNTLQTVELQCEVRDYHYADCAE